ncbi:hypothetical protein VQ042_23590 [Aurantimonas sp. A2-1-M11]|uniref:hypothetical protein n=1 Tax=Aurantimonas sp. A2-1-M11 TaxID=3113712 RepID=UPI002F940374
MKRVIGMDIHRTFAEVVFWEGGRLSEPPEREMTTAVSRMEIVLTCGRRIVADVDAEALARVVAVLDQP